MAQQRIQRAEREINANLAGTATLNVVWEGKIPRALYRPEVYDSMLRFQKAIERNHGAVATLSLADYIPYTGLILRGGNPKWLPLSLPPPAMTWALTCSGPAPATRWRTSAT